MSQAVDPDRRRGQPGHQRTARRQFIGDTADERDLVFATQGKPWIARSAGQQTLLDNPGEGRDAGARQIARKRSASCTGVASASVTTITRVKSGSRSLGNN